MPIAYYSTYRRPLGSSTGRAICTVTVRPMMILPLNTADKYTHAHTREHIHEHIHTSTTPRRRRPGRSVSRTFNSIVHRRLVLVVDERKVLALHRLEGAGVDHLSHLAARREDLRGAHQLVSRASVTTRNLPVTHLPMPPAVNANSQLRAPFPAPRLRCPAAGWRRRWTWLWP